MDKGFVGGTKDNTGLTHLGTLASTDFDVARRALATEVRAGAGRLSYLDIALRVLNRSGVELIPR
jgi:hypothetical protein